MGLRIIDRLAPSHASVNGVRQELIEREAQRWSQAVGDDSVAKREEFCDKFDVMRARLSGAEHAERMAEEVEKLIKQGLGKDKISLTHVDAEILLDLI